MYGVMVGERQPGGERSPPPRGERAVGNPKEKDAKKKPRGFTEKIMDYIQKSFNPPLDEAECAGSAGSAPRPRPGAPAALAQRSRFSAQEIKLMYRGFKQECPSGVVDEEAFKHIFSQFFPLGDASQYAHFVFSAVARGRGGGGGAGRGGGDIDFEEFLGVLSRVARGSVQEKLAWVFALYDTDGDGTISRQEMQQVVAAIYELLGRAARPAASPAAVREHVDRIFNQMDADADGGVSPEELARWCARTPAALRSLHTLDTVL